MSQNITNDASFTYTVRDVARGDIDFLAPRLRVSDILEIKAATGMDPVVALPTCALYSDVCCTVLTPDGDCVGILGIVLHPINDLVGEIWMVGTSGLTRFPKTFLRSTQHWIGILREYYAVLWCCVDQRNQKTIRWLEWCGFKFVRQIPNYGYERRVFCTYELLGRSQRWVTPTKPYTRATGVKEQSHTCRDPGGCSH